ncbi:helix-turn-helix domain-containing protein [Sporosarcina soli]|uniref:Helix-turn-helix domain-containing protein n=1 Tax=Sporosarcina soli TaxID=334736 RepID=A0ABW0TGP0_9BACL
MLGKRLAKLRNDKGLSQYELAEILGFSRGKLANYEQGSRQPDYDTLKIFARYFGVSTDYLLGNSDRIESSQTVTVDDQNITFSTEELHLFEVLKKHPSLFQDLATDPETKVRELSKLYRMKRILLDEDEDD